MDSVIGLPESSVRGFWMACAGFAVDASVVVARLRRGMRCACAKTDVRVGMGLGTLGIDGARKSRYSDGEVAALLYVLKDWQAVLKGLIVVLVAAPLATRKQDAHMVDGDAIIATTRLYGERYSR